MTTISKNTQIAENTPLGKFYGVSHPGVISGLFGRVGGFEVTYQVCGKTLDDKITVTRMKYAELIFEDSNNYYFSYCQ